MYCSESLYSYSTGKCKSQKVLADILCTYIITLKKATQSGEVNQEEAKEMALAEASAHSEDPAYARSKPPDDVDLNLLLVHDLLCGSEGASIILGSYLTRVREDDKECLDRSGAIGNKCKYCGIIGPCRYTANHLWIVWLKACLHSVETQGAERKLKDSQK